MTALEPDEPDSPERVWALESDAARWTPSQLIDRIEALLEPSDPGDMICDPAWCLEPAPTAQAEQPSQACEISSAPTASTARSLSHDEMVRRVQLRLIMANAQVNWNKIVKRLADRGHLK